MSFEVRINNFPKLDLPGLSDKEAIKVIEKELYNIMAEHSQNYDSRKGPDGTTQKANSSYYAALKATKGIKVGSQKFKGGVPTILTGDMKNSRAIKIKGNLATLGYEGSGRGNVSNPEKASYLIKKGYKLNYLSAKNITSLESAVGRWVQNLLKKAVSAK